MPVVDPSSHPRMPSLAGVPQRVSRIYERLSVYHVAAPLRVLIGLALLVSVGIALFAVFFVRLR